MTNCILTYVDDLNGPYGPVAVLAAPRMEAYAKRCNAEWWIASGPCLHSGNHSRRVACNLYRFDLIYEALANYERVLWLDLDILVRPDSPDLFQLVRPGYFAALEQNEVYYAEDLMASRDDLYWNKRIMRFCAENGWAVPDAKGCIIDSGVMLVNRCYRDIFQPIWDCISEDGWHRDREEMLAVNVRLFQQHHKIHYLPQCFNLEVKRGYRRPWRSNYFLHYAGFSAEDKADLMTKHSREWDQMFGEMKCTA